MSLKEKVIEILKEKKCTLTTAESATCGLIGSEIGSVSGASVAYVGGFITYNADTKHHLLNIDIELINQYGTVSKEIAEAMVVNACLINNTNCGISVTGIAGPSPLEGKPVGLFYIGIKVNDKVIVKECFLDQQLTRNEYRTLVVDIAFNELIKNL